MALAAALACGFGAAAEAQAGACAPIVRACKEAGYSMGDAKSGKGLMRNCVNPILAGQGGTNGLPAIDAKTIAQCSKSQPAGAGGKQAKAAKLAAINGTPAPGPGVTAARALPASGRPAAPNIVMVLVDDFSLNLMTEDRGILQKTMPNLAQMMKDGASFTNYFVTDSLCCPSRSSIFTGLLPHNSQVFTNIPPNGGYGAFMAHGDDGKTFALTLHDAYYRTAMMGKYLNGYQPDEHGVPKGWSEWAVAGNGYPNFNYVLDHSGTLITSPLHLTDELSQLGQDYIAANAKAPFFLEIATFSPHAPYVPPDRYKTAFSDIDYPKTPAYGARPDADAPDWLQQIPKLNADREAKMAEDFRKRLRSDKGVDDMIGALRKTLADLGLAQNTYVIFTSDNGYHMGEYSLHEGKMTPFDTDIHVPLVILGPGIAAGQKIDRMTMNIDFYPTFAEWAGSPANPDVDGHSLAGLLRGEAEPWRQIALVEHKQDDGMDDEVNPDAPPPKSGNPPDYKALRLPEALYVEYQDGGRTVVNYYDLKADPYELHNIAGTLSAEKLKALHEALVANASCKGQTQCWAAQSLTP